MERELLQELKFWKSAPRRKPLILMGVRQAGKTHLLEDFGAREFSRYHIVNFEKDEGVHSLFGKALDPKLLIQNLRIYLQKDIDIKNDFLIFDEIQACSRALTSFKYFCEEMPELALCGAGSLLGLHLNEGSYPVGKVDMMRLGPMSFSEFLRGTGETWALECIAGLNLESQIPEILHQRLWELVKHYFITGGMPEVVKVWAEEKANLFKACTLVRKKQEDLINGYYADIAKHAGKANAMHVDRTWRAIPKQLSENQDLGSQRFRFNQVIPKINRYPQLAHVIDWLQAAELIIKVPIIHSAEMPLLGFSAENLFKLLIFDVGILGALSGLAPEAILSYDYGTYKGYFAENYVAQQLLLRGPKTLYNWQCDRSEIEFLVEHRGHVVPIEVKAGRITQAKSLDKFIKKFSPKLSFIFSAKPIAYQAEKNIWHLPLYLVDRWQRFFT